MEELLVSVAAVQHTCRGLSLSAQSDGNAMLRSMTRRNFFSVLHAVAGYFQADSSRDSRAVEAARIARDVRSHGGCEQAWGGRTITGGIDKPVAT
ncbi:MAG: hypothetical protein RLZZ436_200 [Planctomycetota bacterium]|jgi:hypothetical protein